jgi:imidazolonepropionase-like amidohydrolase
MPPRLPALLAEPPRAGIPLWLTGGAIFDGTGSAARPGVAVLVRDGVIAAIAPAGEPPPADADVIELDGRTLLPGLIDAHAHVRAELPVPDPGAEPLLPNTRGHFIAADLRETLRRGITTVRDVGSYDDIVFEARQAMRYGAFRGPRLLTCGAIVSATAPGGRWFPGMYREADGPDDVRRAVREQLRRGADFIKVMTTGARSVELEDPDPAQMTREEVATLVEETHRQGYRTAAHAEGLAGTELAILQGIDTIEHGIYLNQRPDLLGRMAASGQVLVPTLSCFYGVAGLDHQIGIDDGAIDEPNARDRVGVAYSPCHGPERPWTPLLVQLAHYNLRQADLTLRAALAAGVTVAAGHDWHPFWDHALELRRMIAHGMTPAQSLAAATAGAAYALGIGDHVGTIAAGKVADLVVFDGDPLAEPALLSRRDAIWLVLQSGAPVAGAALEPAQLRTGAAPEPAATSHSSSSSGTQSSTACPTSVPREIAVAPNRSRRSSSAWSSPADRSNGSAS